MKVLLTAVQTGGKGFRGGFRFGSGKCPLDRLRLVVITDKVVAAMEPLLRRRNAVILDRDWWVPRFEERPVATWYVDAQREGEKTSKKFCSIAPAPGEYSWDPAIPEKAREWAKKLQSEGWRVTHTGWNNPKWYPSGFCNPLDGQSRSEARDRLAGDLMGAACSRLEADLPEDFIRWTDTDQMKKVQRWLRQMLRPNAVTTQAQQDRLRQGRDTYDLRATGNVVDITASGVVVENMGGGRATLFRQPKGWKTVAEPGWVDGPLFEPVSRTARADLVMQQMRKDGLTSLTFDQACGVCDKKIRVVYGQDECPECGGVLIPAMPVAHAVVDKRAFLIELPEDIPEDGRIPFLGIQDPRTLQRVAELENSWSGQPWKKKLDTTVRRSEREKVLAKAAQPKRFKNLQMILA